jgi:hypothetical protein
VNSEVFDAPTGLYGSVIYCERRVVGKAFCIVFAVAGYAVKEF